MGFKLGLNGGGKIDVLKFKGDSVKKIIVGLAMNRKIIKVLSVLLIGVFSTSLYAVDVSKFNIKKSTLKKVPCNSYKFSAICTDTECYIETRLLKVNEGARNLTLSLTSGSGGMWIYPDENTKPFKINTDYTNGELEKGSGGFNWSNDIKWYKDGKGSLFFSISEGETKQVLISTNDFFIKRTNINKNKTSGKPIFEIIYQIKYYRQDNKFISKLMNTCVMQFADDLN